MASGTLAPGGDAEPEVGPETLPHFGLPGPAEARVNFFIFNGIVRENGPPPTEIPGGFFPGRNVSIHRSEVFCGRQTSTLVLDNARLPVPAFRDAVRQKAAEADVNVGFCLCAGGIPGIYVSIENDFDLIVGLSAVVGAGPNESETPQRAEFIRQMCLDACGDEGLLDIRGHLEASGRTKPIRLVYPSQSPRDALQARVLARHPAVQTFMVPSSQHGFWAPFGMKGAIRRLFVDAPGAIGSDGAERAGAAGA